MALEGSIKEFNLADILQLLFFQRKTGVLTLQSRDDKVRLMFNEGNMVGCESRKKDVNNRLGRMLVGQKVLTSAQLEEALKRQKEKGGRFGSVLVREGMATAEQIQEMLKFQITETLVQLFSWTEGKYGFEAQAVPVDKDIPVVVNTEHFLMEGLRFVDEWSTIKDKITPESVFVRLQDFPGGLSPDEEKVMGFIDGVNDVVMISDYTGMDSFKVSSTILGLVDRGIVALKKEEAVVQEVVVTKVTIPGLSYIIGAFAFVAFIASLFGFFAFDGGALKSFRASEDIDRLRTGIRTTYYETGSYPQSIDKVDPWGTPYIYTAAGGWFTLKSAGPDRTADTQDDIL